MACGSGCTDCPNCRGDVLPDSPVMKDIRYAMDMYGDPTTWDPVTGPLSIADTLLDGVQRRGGPTPSDLTALRYLDAEVHPHLQSTPTSASATATAPARVAPSSASSSAVVQRANVVNGILLDEKPVPWLFDASDKPPAPPPPPNPPRTTAPVITGVHPAWKTFLEEHSEYLPSGYGQGGGTLSAGGPVCEVIEFKLPLAVRPLRMPLFGFFFIASLIFKNKPPTHLCGCCVFRQLIRMVSRGNKKFRHDVSEGSKGPYGGARGDDTKGPDTSKDDREKDAAHWGSNGCRIWYDDKPGPPGPFYEGFEASMHYEFIGLVFDRCNNWALRAAKSMTLKRSATLKDGAWVDDKGSPLVVSSDAPPGEPGGEEVTMDTDKGMKQLVEDLKASDGDY